MKVFLFSFNAIAPMILPAVIGYIIMRKGHIDQSGVRMLNTICFRYLLPFHVFNSTLAIDFYADFNPPMILFCTVGIIATLLAALLVYPRIIRDRGRRCSFVISGFRSNNVIYALPLAVNLFGDSGIKAAAMLIPVTIILFNLFSVVLFVYYSGSKTDTMAESLRRTAIDTARNPMLLASVLGIVLSLLSVNFPPFLQGGIDNVAKCATPMSLLLLGAQMDIKKLSGSLGQVLIACGVRLVAVPAVAVAVAVALGFRGPELGALMVIFAAPPAVTCLVMARNYDVDADFMAQTVIMATLLSMVTMFLWITLLRGSGLF